MTWVKIDDNMQHHPKIVAAGAIAELLQYRAIQYCGRYLTDGFVPIEAIPALLTGLEHVGLAEGGVPGMFEIGRDCHEIDWPASMVDAGLWHARRNGYLVHDFLSYNRSRAQVSAERNLKSKAGRKGAFTTNSKRYGSAEDAAHGRHGAVEVPSARGRGRSRVTTPPSPSSSTAAELTADMLNPCADGQAGFCVRREFLDRVPPDLRRQCAEHSA